MRFRGVCESSAEAWSVPALAVGMSVDGRAETHAVGCAPDARFRIASVTKPFTATLALATLELGQTTGVWPEDVTVRHLLSHLSGFDCELPEPDTARFGDGDDALARCTAELPSVRRLVGSGDVWSYANTGYWLAGRLAAERCASTYEEALATHVLEPAGLDATSFDEPDLEGTGALVLPGRYPRARRPSGGLTSTVGDLLRFGQWHLEHPSAPVMRTAYGTPVRGVYGLGLAGEAVGGVEVWGHGGSYGGFQSSFLVVPERRAVFAGLTNGSNGGKALKEIEDEFFRLVVGDTRHDPPYRKLPDERYRSFEGAYENGDSRFVVAFLEGSDGLLLESDGEELILLALDERTFQVPVGEHVGERTDFPRPGLGRFGGRLALRVS
jgi:D-alanyl-D-alanine carboxypeptidase